MGFFSFSATVVVKYYSKKKKKTEDSMKDLHRQEKLPIKITELWHKEKGVSVFLITIYRFTSFAVLSYILNESASR